MTGAIRTIRAIVVDHDGGELTVRCIDQLVRSGAGARRRLEVVLVDNGSTAPVIDEVADRFPTVEIRRSSVNLGFGGGCNLGLGDLDGVDAVALVNSDVEVVPGWLDGLCAALEADCGLGAASPKMLLADPFVDVHLESPTASRRRGDRRQLGVRYIAAERPLGARCQPHVVSGFHDLEPGGAGSSFRWTAGRAHLRVPVAGATPTTLRLRLDADGPTPVEVAVGTATTTLTVGPGAAWHDVAAAASPLRVVNNAGVVLDGDGFGADRGYLAPDDGSWDQGAPVEAWSGGAVLLRATALRELGGFLAELFLYYEDVELSLRGARAGWRYRYVPESVVDHVHSGSVGPASPFVERLKDRNRLVVAARHGPLGALPGRCARYLLATASYAVRDGLVPLLNGGRPRPTVVVRRLLAFAGFLRRLPSALRRRRSVLP